MLIIKNNFIEYQELFKYGGFFLLSLLFLGIFYFVSLSNTYTNKIKAVTHFFVLFPFFLSVSMGLSLHNAIAVVEGYLGKKTPFVRTPKFNIIKNKDSWKGNRYLISNVSMLTVLEMVFAVYFFCGIISAFYFNDYVLIPFHAMLFFGFTYVSFYSVFHSKKSFRS